MANPGPVALQQQFDFFVDSAYRHEARHTSLLQTRSFLTSNLARDRMQKREWLLVEPSPTGGPPNVFNASLQELGTHLSSVLLQLAESNDTARLSFTAIESLAISMNREQYLLAMNQSISLRQLDVVKSFNFAVLLFSVLGVVCIVSVSGLSAYYLVQTLTSIRDRTAKVASLAFLVPARTAKRLKQKTIRRLTKLANQLDEVDDEDDDDQERMDLLDDEDGISTGIAGT